MTLYLGTGVLSVGLVQPFTPNPTRSESYTVSIIMGERKGSFMSVFRLFSVVKSTHFDLDLLSPNFGGSQILVVFLVQMNLDVTVFLFDYKERFLRNRGMDLLV